MARANPFDDEFTVGAPTRHRAVPRAGAVTVPPAVTPPVTPPTTTTGQEYSDPYTNLWTSLAQQQMAQRSQPFSDPMLDEVIGLIRGQVGKLQAEPDLFSPVEEDRLFTRGWDSLERRRTDAKQRAKEDLSRRGHAYTSGALDEQYRDIDRGFDADRTRGEADIAMYMTGERNTRRTQRDQQLLQLAGTLADISAVRRGETRANQNDVLQISQALSQLGPQRLALMMNVLNGTGGNDTSGLFTNTLNLSNAQQNQNNYNAQGQAAMMSGLGQLIGSIMANYGSRT